MINIFTNAFPKRSFAIMNIHLTRCTELDKVLPKHSTQLACAACPLEPYTHVIAAAGPEAPHLSLVVFCDDDRQLSTHIGLTDIANSESLSAVAIHGPSRRLSVLYTSGELHEHVFSSSALGPGTLVARFQFPAYTTSAVNACIEYNTDGKQLAVSVGSALYGLVVGPTTHPTSSARPWANAIRHVLQGHSLPILSLAFTRNNHLISLAEDHTFKIWDLGLQACVFQSPIIAPTSSMMGLTVGQHALFVASSDGLVREFQLASLLTEAKTGSHQSQPRAIQPRLTHVFNVGAAIVGNDQKIRAEAARSASTTVIPASGRAYVMVPDMRADSAADLAAVSSDVSVVGCSVVGHTLVTFTRTHMVVFNVHSRELATIVELASSRSPSSAAPVPPTTTTNCSLFAPNSPAIDLDIGMLASIYAIPSLCTDSTPSSLASFIALPIFSGPPVVLNLSLDSHMTPLPSRASASADRKEFASYVAHCLGKPVDETMALDVLVALAYEALSPVESKWSTSSAAALLAALSAAHLVNVGDLASIDLDSVTVPMGTRHMLEMLRGLVAHRNSRQFSLFLEPISLANLMPASPLYKFGRPAERPTPRPSALDKPITFRKTVKSSGYTAAPVIPKHISTARQQKVKQSGLLVQARHKSALVTQATAGCWRSTADLDMRNLGSTTTATSADAATAPSWQPEFRTQQQLFSSSSVTSIVPSSSGRSMLAASSSGGVCVFGWPEATQAGYAIATPRTMFRCGEPVTCASWSHDDTKIAVCTGRGIMLWDMAGNCEQPDAWWAPLDSKSTVTTGRFLYKSRFVVAANGDRLDLIRFRLDSVTTLASKPLAASKSGRPASTTSVIRPRSATSDAKTVWHLDAPQNAQQITALATWNAYDSPLVAFATSNKGLYVADLNHGASIMQLRTEPVSSPPLLPQISSQGQVTALSGPGSGVRAIFSIHAAEGCSPAALPFLTTTAPGDLVRLWDLRTGATVVRMGANLVPPRTARAFGSAGAVLSPDATLVAVPTDSATVALLDVRMSGRIIATLGVSRRDEAATRAGVLSSRSLVTTAQASTPAAANPTIQPLSTMGGDAACAVAFHPFRSEIIAGTARGAGLVPWTS
ncbi:hypothetical protein BC828DRAFT_61539 [Blastocladiella britannica]|nr:hypothetical protein BC828DRAFT_61539 [Blastocladiella britannica]